MLEKKSFGGGDGGGWLNGSPRIAGGASGESVDYITTFPDGTKAAVPNTIVDSQGRFTKNDVAYQLKRDASGRAVAVAL